jgi:hypothetical protein
VKGRDEREIPDRELPARPAFRDGLTRQAPVPGDRERLAPLLGGLEGRSVLKRNPTALLAWLTFRALPPESRPLREESRFTATQTAARGSTTGARVESPRRYLRHLFTKPVAPIP